MLKALIRFPFAVIVVPLMAIAVGVVAFVWFLVAGWRALLET